MRATDDRRNPAIQALLTFPRWARSWGRIGYLVAGGVILLGFLLIPPIVGKDAKVCLWVLPYLFVVVVSHVKSQFADSRAHLMPGFRRAHALAAAVWAGLFAVVLPAGLAWLAGAPPLGFVALALCLLGAIGWLALQSPPLCWLVVIFVPMAATSEWSSQFLDQLVAGRSAVQAIGLAVAGLAATSWAGFRMARLDEDMPAYCRPGLLHPTQAVGPYAANHRGLLRGLWDWFLERDSARLARHARRAGDSPWPRVCRWQTGMPSVRSAISSAVYLIAFFELFGWTSGHRLQPVQWLVICSMVLPAATSFGLMFSRRRVVAFELMLPVDRAAYLRQVGVAAAVRYCQLWAAMALAAVAWLAILRSLPPAATTAGILAISASLQVLLFGVGAWFARARPRLLLSAAVFGGIFGAMMPLVMAFSDAGGLAEHQPLAYSIAALLAIVGVSFARAAYCRWLAADID